MNNFSNYDPKIISIYEILGSYFTDILFNHIYLTIKGSKNAIDEYVKNVKNYVAGMKNNVEYYNKTTKEIHQYFLKHVNKKTTDLTYAGFISRIVSASTPGDYYSQLSPSDKEDIFSNIISELIASMAAFVTTHEMLQIIITAHTKNPKTTIRTIQDNAVNFLIEKRALLHNKFVKSVGEVKETTAVAYTEDLKKALKKAIKEKNDAIADLEDALDELDALKEKYHKSKKELEAAKVTEAKLRKFIDLLNVKSEKGVIAAANSIKQPPQDTLAEGRVVPPHENDIPNRENIAERAVSWGSTRGENSGSNKIALSNFFTKPISIPTPTHTPTDENNENNISQSYIDLLG
jgi:cell shape-determining protein MreC